MELKIEKIINLLELLETIKATEKLSGKDFIQQTKKTLVLQEVEINRYLVIMHQAKLVDLYMKDQDDYLTMKDPHISIASITGLAIRGYELLNKLKGNDIKRRVLNKFTSTAYGASIELLEKFTNEMVNQ